MNGFSWLMLLQLRHASVDPLTTYAKHNNSKRPRFLQSSSPEQGIWRQGFGHQPCSKIRARFVDPKGGSVLQDASAPRFMNPFTGCLGSATVQQ